MSSTSCSAATSSLLSAKSLSALPNAGEEEEGDEKDEEEEEPPPAFTCCCSFFAALSARSTSSTCLRAAASSWEQVAEMTAAGTIVPAKVFVLGAGVAGLQAIATAKRLGAVVTAYDVRPVVKEQVQSLGAAFVAVEDEEFKQAETAGGYAKEMSAEYKAKQAALIAETIKKQDIVITTALIPGRKAPVLVSAEMVASMKPGAVLIDLAVEQGGNVEGARPGEVVVTANGVKIVGHLNVPSRIAVDASALYARNLLSLLQSFVDKKTGAFAIPWSDEIVKGVALTRDGQIIHPAFAPAAPAAGSDD